MRYGLAVAAASAMLAAGFVASPTYAAAPAPVGAVTVTPSIDRQGVAYATVSWASEDPQADGVLVCVRPGTGGTAHALVTLDRTRLYQWRFAAPHLHELAASSTRYEVIVSH